MRHAASGRWRRPLAPAALPGMRTRGRADRRARQSDAGTVRPPGVFFHHELMPPSRVRGFEYRYAHHSAWRFPEFDFVGTLPRAVRPARGPGRSRVVPGRGSRRPRDSSSGVKRPSATLTAIAQGRPRRVAFVVAGPGFGKSTLLARWIAQMESEASRERPVARLPPLHPGAVSRIGPGLERVRHPAAPGLRSFRPRSHPALPRRPVPGRSLSCRPDRDPGARGRGAEKPSHRARDRRAGRGDAHDRGRERGAARLASRSRPPAAPA